MGVMLSLGRQRPARGRRHGQHERHPVDRARAQAPATGLRQDPSVSGWLLTRLAWTALARKERGGRSDRGGRGGPGRISPGRGDP
jgi:hypothetical protein